jgi:hypothetical protein
VSSGWIIIQYERGTIMEIGLPTQPMIQLFGALIIGGIILNVILKGVATLLVNKYPRFFLDFEGREVLFEEEYPPIFRGISRCRLLKEERKMWV